MESSFARVVTQWQGRWRSPENTHPARHAAIALPPRNTIGRAPSLERDALRTCRAAEAVSVVSSCLMDQESGSAQHARPEQEDGERMEPSKGDPACVIGG